MEDSYSIDVVVDGKEYSFEVQLSTTGYLHKFYVTINGIGVIYEPDEERNYRAILNNPAHDKINDTDIALIKAVGEKIQSIA